MNEFQKRLIKAMSDRGMTAADVSSKSKIDKGSLSNYINGKYIPKQGKAYVLAEALGVDPGWLMTGDVPMAQKQIDHIYYENSEAWKVARAFEDADDWKKEAVKKILDIE